MFNCVDGYTGRKVPLIGKILVNVQYECQSKILPTIGMESDNKAYLVEIGC